MPVLDVLRKDDGHVAVAHENLVIVVWKSAPDAATCHALYDLGVSVARNHRTGKISVLSVLQPVGSAPSASAREAIGDLHEDPERVVHRTAVVLPQAGFIAAAIRSIILTATQRSDRRRGHGVFSTIDEALTWVVEDLPTAPGHGISVPALLDALGGSGYLGTRRT